MMDEKQVQPGSEAQEPQAVQPRMENELSDKDLELVVGGVSMDAALNNYLQLIENWNQGGS